KEQCAPFYSAAETVPGEGFWEVGDHKLQLDFWPFNHKLPVTLLRRQGVPSGTTSTPPEYPRPSMISPRTARQAPRTTATTGASPAWGRPTCWEPTEPINTLPRKAPRRRSTRGAASGRS